MSPQPWAPQEAAQASQEELRAPAQGWLAARGQKKGDGNRGGVVLCGVGGWDQEDGEEFIVLLLSGVSESSFKEKSRWQQAGSQSILATTCFGCISKKLGRE